MLHSLDRANQHLGLVRLAVQGGRHEEAERYLWELQLQLSQMARDMRAEGGENHLLDASTEALEALVVITNSIKGKKWSDAALDLNEVERIIANLLSAIQDKERKQLGVPKPNGKKFRVVGKN